MRWSLLLVLVASAAGTTPAMARSDDEGWTYGKAPDYSQFNRPSPAAPSVTPTESAQPRWIDTPYAPMVPPAFRQDNATSPAVPPVGR